MKLVPIKYDTGVQSLGRERGAALPYLAQADLANTIVGVSANVIVQHRRKQLENTTAELELEINQWKREHAERESYDSSEVSGLQGIRLTEDIVDDNGDIQTVPRHEIPAYEVQAQLYEKYAQNLIKSKSGSIENASDRGLWQTRMQGVLEGQVADSRQRTLRLMQDAQDKRTITNYNTAMDSQNYSTALSIISISNLPEEKKEELRRDVYEREERDVLDNILIENNRASLVKALESMTDEETYDAAGGKLTDAERLQYARSFRAAINALDASARADAEAWKNRTKREIRRGIEALNSGYGHKVSPSAIDSLRKKAQLLGEDDAGLGDELDMAVHGMVARESFKRGTPEQRAAMLRDLEAQVSIEGGGSPESVILLNEMRKSHEESTIAQRQDPLQYANDTNVVRLSPLDIDELDSDMAETRILDRDASQVHYRMDIPLLTKQEAETWTEAVEDMTDLQKIGFVTKVNQAFGNEEAEKVFTQLGVEDESGSWAYAGVVYSHDPTAARNIIRGSKIRGENKEIIKNYSTDFSPAIAERIGGSSAYFNRGTRKSVEQAILDTYAYLADKDGDYSGDYDEARLDTAVQAVTGGLIRFNGVMIQPPVRGMSDDTFADWVDNLSPDYITQLGGVMNYDNERIIEFLRDGTIVLYSHGPNEYIMKDVMNDGQVLYSQVDGMPFTFKYSRNAPTAVRAIKPEYYNISP